MEIIKIEDEGKTHHRGDSGTAYPSNVPSFDLEGIISKLAHLQFHIILYHSSFKGHNRVLKVQTRDKNCGSDI